jgi:outer membrane protein TolC
MLQMKYIGIIIISLVSWKTMFSQEYTLEGCYQLARQNYPLIKEYDLIEKAQNYNIASINKSYLPQLSLQARGSWQSDITEFPDTFMDRIEQMGIYNLSFPDKSQYRIVLELYQTIWNGGVTAAGKKMTKAQSEIERQNKDISIYAIYSQINQLYFGILLLKEQLAQNTLFGEELQRNYERIRALKENGLASQSDIYKIQVEQITLLQTKTTMENNMNLFRMMLSLFIGEEIPSDTALVKPEGQRVLAEIKEVKRPELKLFDAQQYYLHAQKIAVLAKGMPQIGLFAQGAYANPGLNMFKSGGFTPYFIGGISLSWNIGGLYSFRNERNTIEISYQRIEVQRELFLFSLNQKILQDNAEIDKINALIQTDKEIIALREQIKEMSEIKVQNGTLSVNEYLQDIITANLSKQNKALHEIQLLLSIYQLKIEKGELK